MDESGFTADELKSGFFEDAINVGTCVLLSSLEVTCVIPGEVAPCGFVEIVVEAKSTFAVLRPSICEELVRSACDMVGTTPVAMIEVVSPFDRACKLLEELSFVET